MSAVQPSASKLRSDKREAIMTGGREVFAREGYARSSIDAIASTAGVSTRTIYKHFTDKRSLFLAVVVESATQVADAETALIERRLQPVATSAQVEPALVSFASEWLAGKVHTRSHRALVAQVQAEANQLGEEVVAAWWRTGPRRVTQRMVDLFAHWGAAGFLDITDDGEHAAAHFKQLITAQPVMTRARLTKTQRAQWVADGVRVFLRAYRPASTR